MKSLTSARIPLIMGLLVLLAGCARRLPTYVGCSLDQNYRNSVSRLVVDLSGLGVGESGTHDLEKALLEDLGRLGVRGVTTASHDGQDPGPEGWFKLTLAQNHKNRHKLQSRTTGRIYNFQGSNFTCVISQLESGREVFKCSFDMWEESQGDVLACLQHLLVENQILVVPSGEG
jgi:hypothetical protein